MRTLATSALFLVSILLVGCTPRPSPADRAAIERRVSDFRHAWKACEPQAFHDSILINTPAAREFVTAQVELMAARVRLRKSFGMIWQATPWSVFNLPTGDITAAADNLIMPELNQYSRRPWEVMVRKPDGSVDLIDYTKVTVFLIRRDDHGVWLIDPATFGDLARQTQRAREDAQFANQYTDDLVAAFNSRSPERLQELNRSLIQRMAQHLLRAEENPPGVRRVTTTGSTSR